MSVLRQGRVLVRTRYAGMIRETDSGYEFEYDPDYLHSANACAVSLTLPLQADLYVSPTLFPFFDGLIPEGWLLEIAVDNWKLNSNDRMGLLLACCRDCIGAASVREVPQ